jgi:hypothetical protein
VTYRLGTGKSLTFFYSDILYWSRIHQRIISLRFLGIILRALRLEGLYGFLKP